MTRDPCRRLSLWCLCTIGGLLLAAPVVRADDSPAHALLGQALQSLNLDATTPAPVLTTIAAFPTRCPALETRMPGERDEVPAA